MIEEQIAKILTEKKLILSVAESCTGGLISSRLTDVSGASNFIHQNFVTYANSAKVKFLDVEADKIEKFGVVSDIVALQMAKGQLKKGYSDISIATTGILGPTGFTKEKPIGLCYIAFAFKDKSVVHKFISKKENRIEIKNDIVDNVFKYFLDFLVDNT